MEKVNTLGMMEVIMMVTGVIIKLMDTEFINGQMVVDMKVNGKTNLCTETENIQLMTVECILDNIKTIKNMDKDVTLG